jgi:hypothetical protein
MTPQCFGCGGDCDAGFCRDCGELAARLAVRLLDSGYPEPPGFDVVGWLVPLVFNEVRCASPEGRHRRATSNIAAPASTPTANSSSNSTG